MTQKTLNPFSRLLLRQKFAVLAVIAMILVGVALYAFVGTQMEKINVTKREQQGLKTAKELLALVEILPRHRGSSTGLLNGNNDMASEEKATKTLADQQIAAFDKLSQSITDPALLKAWAAVKQDWPKIAQKVDTRTTTPPENFKAHTQLIADVLNILDLLVDFYGLSLDPYAESYFLMRSILVDSPILTEYLGQARGWGTGLLAKVASSSASANNAQNSLTLQDRSKLSLMTSIANSHIENVAKDFNKFLAINQKLQTPLEQQLSKATLLVKEAIALSDTEIVSKPVPNFSSTAYYTQYSQAINEMYKVIDIGFNELDAIFTRQIKTATEKLLIISTVIVSLLLVCALIAIFIVNSITRPVSLLLGVMQKLAAGDSKVRANLEAEDEIGVLGRQFDSMVDQREAVRVKIEQENDTLNNSIVELLMTVAKLAQKDLTVRATVEENVTGPLSDALNLLSDETAKVLNRVVQIAGEVAGASLQVQSQSAQVINVAAEEKLEVEQAANELGAASVAMLEIAKLAVSCNEAAEKAIKNTDKAQETVLGTIQGITTIRDTIRETEKRIKRLGERSQEIGGVVSLINDIAERTHILSINASMHAASAGEAGRGFAVVANEVQKLAENSREATSKISALVNNIQVETADTVITMNNAISQVVRGTELAQQAGDEMRETRDTTADLVQLVERISASSTTQSENSQRLVERAKQIQKSTEETYSQLQDQGTQTELLVNLSGMLVASVDVFTLPQSS
ncbi:MAG: methyl-accepting chemotaxis protein [Methylococcales bacterium]|nr:methyl-accepting chemotaxis protein [Methylococcales bacterium]